MKMSKNDTLINSFIYAFSGIRSFIKYERNAKIHFIASLLAVILGIILKISLIEWGLVFVAIALVWGFELVNTAIEKACDKIQPDLDQSIKVVKDLAAGSVLVVAFASILIGVLVFLPHIVRLLYPLMHYK
jgi:diacylglycerol kinase